MAKRSRGTSRPGQRPATRRATRPAGRPAAQADASRAAGSLTTTEDPTTTTAATAAEMPAEAGIDTTGRARPRDKFRASGQASTAARPQSGLLAAKAAQEYQYVVRDVRRIAMVGGGLVAVLAVLFVLIDVLGVIQL
jgi:hypothetical protein